MAVVSISRDQRQAGDRATCSGIYRVVHHGHRRNHTVIVLRGDVFPQCRFCKDAPVFILVEATPYIAHDLDFAGPEAELRQG